MNTSQSLLVSKDGSKFWSSQMWWHFLTHAKHFEGECSFVLKGGSGIHFYTDLHFTTTSKEVKKGNYLIVHWNYKTVIFSMTSWLHFHNLFSKGNLGTFMIVCGTKLEFSAPLSTTLCQKAGVSEISTFYYYIFKPVISTDFLICWNSFRSRNFRRTGFPADSHTQE